MPATEKTWRDQAKMHVIFGISALVMLAATIWMLAKDHNREWRQWQLDDRDAGSAGRSRPSWPRRRPIRSRSSIELQKELDSGAERARSTRRSSSNSSSSVTAEDERLAEQDVKETPADFTKLDAAAAALAAAPRTAAPAAAAARDDAARRDGRVRSRGQAARRCTADEPKKFVAADQTAADQRPRHRGRRRQADATKIEAQIAELADRNRGARRGGRRGEGLSASPWKRSSSRFTANELDLQKQIAGASRPT